MTETMIPVHLDVLQGLWATRKTGNESWSDLIGSLLPVPAPLPESPEPPATPSRSIGPICYEVLGETRSAPTAIDMLVDVLRILGELDPSFLPRLAPLVRGRTRNHVARSPALV
jgi:hypothetical protein